MSSRRSQAFTLIEVLICIGLLAILIFPIKKWTSDSRNKKYLIQKGF